MKKERISCPPRSAQSRLPEEKTLCSTQVPNRLTPKVDRLEISRRSE